MPCAESANHYIGPDKPNGAALKPVDLAFLRALDCAVGIERGKLCGSDLAAAFTEEECYLRRHVCGSALRAPETVTTEACRSAWAPAVA